MLKTPRAKAVALVTSAAVLGAGAAGSALAITAMGDDDHSPEQALELARSSKNEVEGWLLTLQSASTWTRLVAAGEDAAKRADHLRDKVADANRLESAPYRAAARRALTESAKALDLLSISAGFGTPDLGDARALRDAGVSAQVVLTESTKGWPHARPSADRVAAAPPQHPDVVPTVSGAATAVRRMHRTLQTWRSRTAKVRRERRADLAVLDSYASAVRNYQSQYQDLRSKLEDFLAEIDGRGVTFEEAYNGLGDALSGRAQLKQGCPRSTPRRRSRTRTTAWSPRWDERRTP